MGREDRKLSEMDFLAFLPGLIISGREWLSGVILGIVVSFPDI